MGISAIEPDVPATPAASAVVAARRSTSGAEPSATAAERSQRRRGRRAASQQEGRMAALCHGRSNAWLLLLNVDLAVGTHG
jgi:hypothetical protein